MLAALIAGLTLVPHVAWAHVAVSPGAAVPGQVITLVFTVPNESSSEDTVGIDLRLPRGFDLKRVPPAAGWDVTIDPPSDEGHRFVHWDGGSLPPARIAMFTVRGRTPDNVRQLRFPITQRLERTTVSWTGPSASEYPAAVVSIGADEGPGSGADALPAVPLASPPQPASLITSDDAASRARTRTSLAVSLFLAGLLAGLSGLAIALSRRRMPPTDPPLTTTVATETRTKTRRSTANRTTAKSSAKPARNS